MTKDERIRIALLVIAAHMAGDEERVKELVAAVDGYDLGGGMLGVACGWTQTIADLLKIPAERLLDDTIIQCETRIEQARS
jgi:hypothetical protein